MCVCVSVGSRLRVCICVCVCAHTEIRKRKVTTLCQGEERFTSTCAYKYMYEFKGHKARGIAVGKQRQIPDAFIDLSLCSICIFLFVSIMSLLLSSSSSSSSFSSSSSCAVAPPPPPLLSFLYIYI